MVRLLNHRAAWLSDTVAFTTAGFLCGTARSGWRAGLLRYADRIAGASAQRSDRGWLATD